LCSAYINSLTPVDDRRFTATLNRSKVFDAVISTLLNQQSNCTVTDATHQRDTGSRDHDVTGSRDPVTSWSRDDDVTGSRDDDVTVNEGRDVLILTCAMFADDNVDDMTAAGLRQLFVTQHIRALFKAVNSQSVRPSTNFHFTYLQLVSKV